MSPKGCLGRAGAAAAAPAAAAKALSRHAPPGKPPAAAGKAPERHAPAGKAPAAAARRQPGSVASEDTLSVDVGGEVAAAAKLKPKEYSWPKRSLGIAAQLEALASRPNQTPAPKPAAAARSKGGGNGGGSKRARAEAADEEWRTPAAKASGAGQKLRRLKRAGDTPQVDPLGEEAGAAAEVLASLSDGALQPACVHRKVPSL